MALIPCPECGRQVSDKAASCPQCAHPLSVAPAPGQAGQVPTIGVVVPPRAPLKIRQVGVLLGLVLVGGGVFMFSTMNLSEMGKLIAGALCLLGVAELVTGSTTRAKS